MPRNLKQLILPQYVEDQQRESPNNDMDAANPHCILQNSQTSAGSSDVDSPAQSTFSRALTRFSSSNSSLSSSPTMRESLDLPNSARRPLTEVREEPQEREEEQDDLWDCDEGEFYRLARAFVRYGVQVRPGVLRYTNAVHNERPTTADSCLERTCHIPHERIIRSRV